MNYDVHAVQDDAAAHLRLLQRAVLRHRLRVPALQLTASSVAVPRRQSLLHVVYAGRPRQLLAVQRRPGQHSALPPWPPLLSPAPPDSPGATCSICLRRERRDGWSRGGDLQARESAAGDAWAERLGGSVDWQEVDLLDKLGVERALDSAAAVGRLSLRRGRPRRACLAISTEPTFAANVRGTHHLIEGLRALRLHGNPRPHPELVARLRARQTGRSTEDHPLLPASPYALSKLAQELRRGRELRRTLGARRARLQPLRAEAGSVVRRVRVRATHCRYRGGPLEAGDSGRQSGRAPRSDRRARHRSRLPVHRSSAASPAGRTTSARDGRSPSANCSTCCWRGPACRSRSSTIQRGYRPNDQPIVVGDPTRIRTELGWRAEIPLEKTLDDLLESWRGQSRQG